MFGWFKRNRVNRMIIINAENLETRVAVLDGGRLEEFQVEHPTETRIVGSVFKGKIQNLEHDLQAAFVDIGMKKNAFLHYWDMNPEEAAAELMEEDRGHGRPRRKRFSNQEIERLFPPGSEIVVQVTKGPIGTKGPRVTASLSIPGRYLVLMPGANLRGVSRKITDADERQRLKKTLDRLPAPSGLGLIVRTAADGVSSRSFARDLRGLLSLWDDLQKAMNTKTAPACLYQEPGLVERVIRDSLTEEIDRIVVDSKDAYDHVRDIASQISRSAKGKVHLYDGDRPVFENFNVETQIEEAFGRRVGLKSGGYLIVDETEALLAVDVNTGKYKGSGSQDQAILEVNTEAVEEVARQLRLRNIGGLVVLDLIDMKSRKHQSQVGRTFKAALKKDRARTNVLPISELGLLEMTRQRVEGSIQAQLFVDCPYCKGRGLVKSLLGISVDIQRQIVAILRRQRKQAPLQEIQVVIHPTVMERLRQEDEQFLLDMQTRYGASLSFRSDPSRHVEHFTIRNTTTGEDLYTNQER